MTRKLLICMLCAMTLLPISRLIADDPLDNRVLSGSADLGDQGRHMGVASLGTITITGDDLAADAAHAIRVSGNGYAYLDNGIVIRNASSSELVFDGPNQSHEFEVFFLGVGHDQTGGNYDVDFSLPGTNSYTNGAGDHVASYGGNWFWSANYNKLDGSAMTFTADDVAGSDRIFSGGFFSSSAPAISPLTLTGTTNSVANNSDYNRTNSAQPLVTNFSQDAYIPTKINDGIFDWDLEDDQTPLIERQNTLFQVDAAADGQPNPTLDLSNISITAQGTSLKDRQLAANTINIGRQMVTTNPSQQSVQRTDNVTVQTFGSDAERTRIQLSSFDVSGDGIQASLDTDAIFNDAADTALLELNADFSFDTSEIGTFSKTFNVGNNISSLENLEGEDVQDTLTVGYRYSVVDNNNAVSENVSVFVMDEGSIEGQRIENSTVRREFSTTTHTAISIEDSAILTDSNLQTIDLSEGNGIVGEGLAGENVIAQTSYNVHKVNVASSELETNEGLLIDEPITIENTRENLAGIEAEAILIDGQRRGSTRWSLDGFGNWDGTLGAGESVALNAVFDDSDLPESELGRNYRTSIDLLFQDGLTNIHSSGQGGSALARISENNYAGGVFGILGSMETLQTRTWVLERAIGVEGESGSLTLAAGTSLRDVGINLTNTGDNSTSIPTTITILDSETLQQDTDVSISFTSRDNASEVLQNALGFGELASDIVDVTGLDDALHVIQLSYDPDTFAGQSGAFVSWLDEGEEELGDEIWVNAVLGNSNIDSYDQMTDSLLLAGASEAVSLSEYLLGNLYKMSYTDYLLFETEDSLPVLGAWGFDAENSVAWSVIDHNSTFSSTSVPEPASFGIGAAFLIGMTMRRRRNS